MKYEKRIAPEIAMVSNLINRRIRTYYQSKNYPTLSHGKIIHYLVLNKDHDVFQKDIEKVFFLRRSTATGILQLMEENGLITREKMKSDSRLKKITLTEKAIEFNNRMCHEMIEMEKMTAEGISEEELKTFYRVMDKIKENLS